MRTSYEDAMLFAALIDELEFYPYLSSKQIQALIYLSERGEKSASEYLEDRNRYEMNIQIEEGTK